MNEIRMYVEHLFEGRMLTAENIELKEEIYGNLVARYEDYIEGGMDAEEALRKTKESMTSIDDLLEGREVIDSDATESDAADSEVIDSDAIGSDADANEIASNAGAVTEAAVNEAASGVAGACGFAIEDDEASSSAGEENRVGKRTRTIILASVVGFVVLVVFGLGLKYALVAMDRAEGRGDSAATVIQDDAQDSADGDETTSRQDDQAGDRQETSQSSSGDGGAASARNKEVVVDADGTVWVDGERGDDLAAAVVNAQPGDISLFQDTDPSDAANVESLIRLLPMGEWAADIDVTLGVDVLGLAYREVPDSYDGDSIDLALSYNTMALFCSMPLLNEVRVTVTESDDPADEDYYVFTRDNAQRCFGVRLSSDLMNEAGWHQLKEDNLYSRKFAERMVDMAEREWK